MSLVDVIAVWILIVLMIIAVYATRSKKDVGCDDCKKECSSCSHYSDLYAQYKKDQKDKELNHEDEI